MGRRVSEYKGKGSGYHSDLGQPGRERILEWTSLLRETAAAEYTGVLPDLLGISGMEEPATASTICAQLTTTSDLQRVTDILEEGMPTERNRRAPGTENCMGRGPLRGTNILREWEMVLEGKAFAKKTAVWEPRKMPGTSCAEGVPGVRFWSKTPTEIGCAFDRNRSET